MILTWLVLTDLNRERLDPRRVPPRLFGPAAPDR
jgi:hypothetical protein